MRVVRIAACAVYLVFLSALAWGGGMNGGDEGSDPVAVILLFFLAWAGGSALVGYWLGPLAFVLPIVAVAGAAIVGQVLEEFDNELRGINWIIQIVFSAAFIALGIWLRNRRARRG